ncbi:hypothetical protein FL859_07255 [Listeria monocytogenes]|nr:hypothetical protein [Listeria monocytogenes]
MILKEVNNFARSSKESIRNYEYQKIKKINPQIIFAALLTQSVSFLFFLFVGRYEKTEQILTNFIGIIALSTTVTLCILSLLGAIFIRKYIVQLYVGNQRARTFLFPIKRSQLFLKKNVAFSTIFVRGVGISLLLSYFIEVPLYILIGEGVKLNLWLLIQSFVIKLTCLLLLLGIVTVSEIVAIRLQSEISTIITTVIGITLVANLSVLGSFNLTMITFLACLITVVMVIAALLKTGYWIDKSEVK